MGRTSGDNLNSGHMIQLDSLRALAVIAVVFDHYGTESIAVALNPGGIGVRLFFVLSGFLITGILLDARAKAYRRGVSLGRVLRAFYARRFLRIFPLYYFVLFLCVAFAVPSAREFFVWHVTYMTNVLMALSRSWLPALGHFWSLSVEEQFYLIWPTIVLLTPSRRLTVVLIALIVVGPVSRGLLAITTRDLIPSTLLTPTCLDTLAAGSLVAHLRRRDDWPPSRCRRLFRTALGSGIALYLTWFALRYFHTGWVAKIVIKDLAYSMMFSYVIYRAADGFGGFTKSVLEWRPLVYVGTISYGIYIFHDVLPLFYSMLVNQTGRSEFAIAARGLGPFLFVLISSVAAASLSWYLFEKPINNLKSLFPYVPRLDSPLNKSFVQAPPDLAETNT
jgi:peptidoglycan/LPS O-acetylase OafA/YrhL